MRLTVVSCEIFHREMCLAAARSPNQVDLVFLPKGLHDIGSKNMLARLQDAVHAAEGRGGEAIALGYGLCNNGIAGLVARRLPLVIPRAHDCITLFFGNRARYQDYFESHPGTYFKTTGWIERGQSNTLLPQSIPHRMGMDLSLEELTIKYGEDNARYIYETLCDTMRHYRQLTFIEMGVEPDDRFERGTREEAAEHGWVYEKVAGDMGLIRRLIDGPWNPEDFLVVPPGQRVTAPLNDGIIAAEPA